MLTVLKKQESERVRVRVRVRLHVRVLLTNAGIYTVISWLEVNLLALSTMKTIHVCFYTTNASASHNTLIVKIHSNPTI